MPARTIHGIGMRTRRPRCSTSSNVVMVWPVMGSMTEEALCWSSDARVRTVSAGGWSVMPSETFAFGR